MDFHAVVAGVHLGQFVGVLNQTIGVDAAQNMVRFFHKGANAGDDLPGTPGLGVDFLHGLVQAQVILQLKPGQHAPAHLGVVGDGRQGLIHLMGKAGSHFAHGAQARYMGQLLLLAVQLIQGFLQGGLVAFFLGNILEYHHRTARSAVFHDGCAGEIDRKGRVIAVQERGVFHTFADAFAQGDLNGSL